MIGVLLHPDNIRNYAYAENIFHSPLIPGQSVTL
jgi:hypothetical protein